VRLGRLERKGAIDTFDAGGYLAMLRRLRDSAEQLVYAPEFRREIDEPIAGAVAVPRDVPLVVTEGNYLLVMDGAWGEVRALLDEAWFIDLSDGDRLARLIQRHVKYGNSLKAAQAKALGSDQRNAKLVATTRHRADVLVQLEALTLPQHLDQNH
jgi:pantothenate kinase